MQHGTSHQNRDIEELTLIKVPLNKCTMCLIYSLAMLKTEELNILLSVSSTPSIHSDSEED